MTEEVVVLDDAGASLLETLASQDGISEEQTVENLLSSFLAKGGYPPSESEHGKKNFD